MHDIAPVFSARPSCHPDDLRAEHPVVRAHPATKERLIYVNGAFVSHIKDMDTAESQALLQKLYQAAWHPQAQCRFRWQPGSFAFWDNRACQHLAVSDHFPAARSMERVTIADDRPY